mgnify:CR=1 FL=1
MVAKDPRTGGYFRMRAVEAFIADLLNGSLELEAIRLRVEQRFGAALSTAELESFVARLD